MKDTCPACGEKESISFFSDYKGSFMKLESLLICKSCDLIFVKDIPSEAKITQYYNDQRYYGDQTEIRPNEKNFYDFSLKLSKSRLDLISKHLDLTKKGLRCLDVGTGNGAFVETIKKYSDISIDFIEPDKRAINASNISYGHHFYSLDDVDDKKYDLIVINQVLEHVSQPILFINKIKNLLKNEGHLYIDTPNRDCEFKDNLSPHILFWNTRSMERFFITLGFNTVFIDSAGMQISDAKIYFQSLTFFQKLTNLNFLKHFLNRKFFNQDSISNTLKDNLDNYGGKRIWIRGIFKKI